MKNHNETQDNFAELRRQAEKRLAERNLPAMSVNALEDARRLITELQVHQIELEMQNDELRQTHEQLNLEREKYADLYNFAPVAYFIFDDRDIILDLNLAAAELIGNERKYLIDHPFTAYVSPESIQFFVEHRQKALETRLPETCELTIRRRDGVPVFVQARTIALRTASTGTQFWRSVMTDITERKRAENIMQARLRITEFTANHSLGELLQNALDELCALSDSPIGFFHFVEYDQNTLSLQAWSTRTLEEMCVAEGKGKHYPIDQAGVWVDCVRERRPVIHNDYYNLPHRKGLPQGHAPVTREMVFPIIRDQKIVAIIGVGNKSFEYTQEDLDYASRLADLIWDIAERKRAQIELLEKEVQYRNLADSGSALIWMSGIDKLCNYFNEPWLKFTGRTLEQEIGNGWTEGVHPDDFERCMQTYTKAFDKREPFDMEYRLRHFSGEYCWIEDLGTPNYNSNGEFVGYIGHCFDITERKHNHKLLEDVNRQLHLQVEEIEKLQEELREQAIRDPLTGLYNRRYMDDAFAREFSRAEREGYSVSIIILDMDELKVFNDTYGHQVGDRAIQMLAKHIQNMIRTEDIICRYTSGDEFAIILSKTVAADALKRVEEWHTSLYKHPVIVDGKSITIKFTAGIASFPVNGNSVDEVVNHADIALYRAKAQGRGRTLVFNETPDSSSETNSPLEA